VRTTVTLDDDLMAALKRRAHERDIPFKRALNDALRAGLAERVPAPKRYRMSPRRLGVRPGVDLGKALQLAADLEDTEITRKLEQGR
jgi:hypothetical protein